MLKLGDKIRDTVTRFEGVMTARIEYLTGSPQVRIEALVAGKPESAWIDLDRAEVVATNP